MWPLNPDSQLGFIWPQALFALVLIPLFWFFRTQYEHFRWQQAFRFSPLGVIDALRLNPSPLKRLWRPVLISLMLLILIVSLARPTATVRYPVKQVNLMLVLDISLSMLAHDIHPTRIEAAKEAAINFIQSLPDDVRVGLELFAGNTYVIQSPSRDRGMAVSYLRSLSERHLQMRTEIGSALKTAVDVLGTTTPSVKNGKPPQQVIVLLSDGDSQEGYPWNVAVAQARAQNITIHTVGIGSNDDTDIIYKGQSYPVRFNETTLRQIASTAGGQYFRVFSHDDFKKVYDQVTHQSIVMEERKDELTALGVGLALLLLCLGLLGEAFWIRRV